MITETTMSIIGGLVFLMAIYLIWKQCVRLLTKLQELLNEVGTTKYLKKFAKKHNATYIRRGHAQKLIAEMSSSGYLSRNHMSSFGALVQTEHELVAVAPRTAVRIPNCLETSLEVFIDMKGHDEEKHGNISATKSALSFPGKDQVEQEGPDHSAITLFVAHENRVEAMSLLNPASLDTLISKYQHFDFEITGKGVNVFFNDKPRNVDVIEDMIEAAHVLKEIAIDTHI